PSARARSGRRAPRQPVPRCPSIALHPLPLINISCSWAYLNRSPVSWWCLLGPFDRCVKIGNLDDNDPAELFFGVDERSVVNPGFSLTYPHRLRQYRRLEHLSADEYLSLLKCGRIRSDGLHPGFDNFGSERRGVFLAVVQ